jgi:hypothetical protein
LSFDLRLTDRRALVTGGAKGVGAAVVEVLHDAGAKVIATARSVPSDANEGDRITMRAGMRSPRTRGPISKKISTTSNAFADSCSPASRSAPQVTASKPWPIAPSGPRPEQAAMEGDQSRASVRRRKGDRHNMTDDPNVDEPGRMKLLRDTETHQREPAYREEKVKIIESLRKMRTDDQNASSARR